MASLTIDNLEDSLLSRLRARADAHGTSVEEEAAAILKVTLDQENPGERLVRVFREEFGRLGGVDLELPPRQSGWKPPVFE
ncbi:FitA-like ribbon-helix-helix domain-containing protein [Enterovirga aerilata]|uniref:Plasmid stabilization protein n=1 Tax=Enterovirga aerilata TaxID=2730920 RepID=A0A849I903_9HYPH|nr:plasmid stabilization protein [Enterovirga sp. DB1703]NNM72477.1 plasmid stabilization protein [Enterovirga sp. DB1703]